MYLLLTNIYLCDSVFANISSQSVYGKMSEPLWAESTPVEPDYLYAMGKYSSEIITKLMLKESKDKTKSKILL